jgi:hypothetical protein
MREDPTKIKIDTVHGGDPRDHQALRRNYFLPTTVNDTYLFYAPSNDLIPTDPPVLATGRDFSFELKEMSGVTWSITNFAITPEIANGNWTNDHQIENDEGTFVAQAGGTLEEEASAAGGS